MSRIFNYDISNRLSAQATANLPAPVQEYTMFSWAKDIHKGGSGDQRGVISFFVPDTGIGNPRYNLLLIANDRLRIYVGSDENRVTINHPENQWILVGWRRRDDPASPGSYLVDMFYGDTILPVAGQAGVPLDVDRNSVGVGHGRLSDNEPAYPFDGKLAHSTTFHRALSDQEITDLSLGANPQSLNPDGRYSYYPLIGSSLANEWDSEVGDLVVTGVVNMDDTDNPVVDEPIVSPSITPTQPPQGGEVFSFSGSNYSAQPTGPMTFTQGTRSISRAVTISNWNAEDGSFTGVTDASLPGVPSTGASDTPALLYGEPVTISLPDPGA